MPPARLLKRQPKGSARINWSNPRTRGLVAAYTNGREFVSGRSVRVSSGLSPKADPAGFLSDTFAQGGGQFLDLGNVVGNSGPLSYVVWAYDTGGNTADNSIVSYGDYGTLRNTGFDFYTYNGTGWDSVSLNSSAYAGAGLYKLTGVHDGSNNYFEGYYPGSGGYVTASAAAGSRSSSTQSIRLGDDTTNSRSFNGTVPIVLVFNRALTANERRSLVDNPWQVFEVPAPRSGALLLPSGTSVALTGVTGTGSVGTVSPSVDKALTGNTGTGSAGTVAPATSAGLTGTSATGSAGTVGVAVDKALTGVTGTASAGTVGVNVVVGLTGVTGTGSVGTVTPSIGASIQLTGVSATGSVGNVAVSVDKALSGVSGTGSAGTVTPGTSAAVSGVSGTASVGTVQSAVSPALSGVSGTGSTGTVGPNVTVGLSGVSATGSVGTVTPSTGATVVLTGVSGTGAVNAPGIDIVIALTGVSGFGSVGDVSIPSAASPGGNAWEKQRQKRRAQVQAEVNRRNLEIIKAELAEKSEIAEALGFDDDDEEALMLLL